MFCSLIKKSFKRQNFVIFFSFLFSLKNQDIYPLLHFSEAILSFSASDCVSYEISTDDIISASVTCFDSISAVLLSIANTLFSKSKALFFFLYQNKNFKHSICVYSFICQLFHFLLSLHQNRYLCLILMLIN